MENTGKTNDKNIDLAQSIDKIFQEIKELKEAKKDVELEKKKITNSDLAKSIDEISQELKTLASKEKKGVEVEKVEEINDNFSKKKLDVNENIFIQKMDLEPFNVLNDFIFKHEKIEGNK